MIDANMANFKDGTAEFNIKYYHCPVNLKLSCEIGRHENSLLFEAKNLYGQARNFIAAEEWLKAYLSLQQIQGIFPNYEDSSQLLSQTASMDHRPCTERRRLFSTRMISKALPIRPLNRFHRKR